MAGSAESGSPADQPDADGGGSGSAPGNSLDWLGLQIGRERRLAEDGAAEGTQIGDIVVRYGWATQEALRECLREHREAQERGETTPLEAILLRRGLVDAEQLAFAMRVLGRGEPSGGGLKQLGRYEILGTLGQGGMGVVYRAVDTALRREVALKVIAPWAVGDEVMRARLGREAHAASRLSHPNLVGVFDVGEQEGIPYMAMELVEGPSLEEVLAVERDVRKKVAWVEKIARAVDYAHGRGVVHRDLKPGNVSMGRDGEPRVMDFGLARVEGEKTKLTLTGTVMGTPAYMAPEQVRGTGVGAPADVYSLGVILYEALCGVVPFQGAEAHEVYLKILNEEPTRPRARDPRISLELEVICLKAMEKEPRRRYATAGELAEDLGRWLAGEPIRARPATWSTKVVKRVRRNPWAWVMAAAGILVAILGALLIVLIVNGAAKERRAMEALRTAGLAYAAGDLAEAKRRVEEAERLAPGHAEAAYWSARLMLREYQARRALPEVRIAGGALEVVPPRGETEERDVRRRIEAAFARIGRRALAEGVLALWDGDCERALEKLSAVSPDEKESYWEARLYRAQALYLRGDFDEARQLLTDYVLGDPALIGPIYGRLLLAKALQDRLVGQETAGWLAQAEVVGRQMEEKGRVAEGRILRARTEVENAVGYLETGRDAESAVQRALALVEGIDLAEASVVAGDAWGVRAEDRRRRGQIEPDEPVEYAEAIQAYSRAVEIDNGYAGAYVRRAEARQERWRFQQAVGRSDSEDLRGAVEDYETALGLSPDYGEAAIGLANARGELARTGSSDFEFLVAAWEAQVRELDQLAERSPGAPRLFLALGETWKELGQLLDRQRDCLPAYERAVQEYSRACEINPRYAEAYVARGRAWKLVAYVRGMRRENVAREYDRALEDFERAIQVNPLRYDAFKERASCLMGLVGIQGDNGEGDLAKLRRGVEDATSAIRINPLDAHAYSVRGWVRWRLGQRLYLRDEDPLEQLQAAISDLSESIRLNPRAAGAPATVSMIRLTLAVVREARGESPEDDLREAIRAATETIEKDPAFPDGPRQRAAAQSRLGDWVARSGDDPAALYEASLRDFDRWRELQPNREETPWERVEVRWKLAEALAQFGGDPRGDLRGVAEDCLEVVGRDPAHGGAWALRGEALRRLAMRAEGDPDLLRAAVESLTRAIELLRVRAAFPYEARGRALLALGRLDQAEQDLRDAILLDPSRAGELEALLERIRAERDDEF